MSGVLCGAGLVALIPQGHWLKDLLRKGKTEPLACGMFYEEHRDISYTIMGQQRKCKKLGGERV